MTQVFQPNGKPVSATAVEAGPCVVTQVKTETKEGYNAIQLGFGIVKRINAAEKGHLKELGTLKHLREFRVSDVTKAKVGDKIEVGILKPGDHVTVIGTSKGKGFAGVVKRHHFKGGPKTHGQSDRQRAPGAIGSTTFPGRVYKGIRMAGHLGNSRVTSRNLEVIQVDTDRNLLFLKGAVPGAPGGVISIRKISSKV
jgi:large subunit ribosomal protein L3